MLTRFCTLKTAPSSAVHDTALKPPQGGVTYWANMPDPVADLASDPSPDLVRRAQAELRPASSAFAERLIRSPLGAITQSRYLDPIGLFALKRLFFPLSRLWAAAGIAETSVPRFIEEAQLTGRIKQQTRFLARQLQRHRTVRQHADAAEQAWQQAFFGGDAIGRHDAQALALIEANRLDGAHRLTMDRGGFLPLLFAGARRQVDWQIPAVAAVEEIYGRYLTDPGAAYAFPDPLPLVERSPQIEGRYGPESWLRFISPSSRIADMACAKISEPQDAPRDMPTVVIGNGVCMEPEMTRGMIDAAQTMCRLGFRVVEITTPWHGRRCPPGWYGGEKFFATAPLGQLDLFTAQARETAVVIDWCRRNFAGPIALAGISLGSFVAQLVATHSANWPAAARPDALLLVTHSAHMEEVVFESGLVEGIGIPAALKQAGWSEADMLRWAVLMDPQTPPVMPAARIVSILGTADRVTPVGGGLDLVRRWNIPAENLFVMRQGHFGTPVRLIRDDAPLRRLKAVLET